VVVRLAISPDRHRFSGAACAICCNVLTAPSERNPRPHHLWPRVTARDGAYTREVHLISRSSFVAMRIATFLFCSSAIVVLAKGQKAPVWIVSKANRRNEIDGVSSGTHQAGRCQKQIRRAPRKARSSAGSWLHWSSEVFRLLLGFMAAAPHLNAACSCPSEALSKRLLVATAPGTTSGFVACGYEDARASGRVRASEFEVFRCDDRKRVLQFGALETADLNEVEAGLHLVRVSNWPFGKHWTWKAVPVGESTLEIESTELTWQPRLPKPELTDTEIGRFLQKYAAAVRHLGRNYTPDENVVAQLFAATVFGSQDAIRLFCSMPHDVNLDGAVLELYRIAVADYAMGRPAGSSSCSGAD
jgi:hypothetical protein